MKFRVLQGKYHSYVRGTDSRDITVVTTKRGEVVESTIDLVKRYNRPQSRMFERLPDDAPMTPESAPGILQETEAADAPTTDVFEGLTVAELHELAGQNGIDLGNASRKADILKAIRSQIEE